MFDQVTGQFIQTAPFGYLLLVVLAIGVGVFIYSRVNHPGYEKLEDAFKKGFKDIREHAKNQWPVVEADIREEVAELEARVKTLLAKVKK